MAEQYKPDWHDPRKMSRRELEDWTARNSPEWTIPEWTDWRPKLMVPRWVIIVMYGALVITFTFAFVA